MVFDQISINLMLLRTQLLKGILYKCGIYLDRRSVSFHMNAVLLPAI